VNSNFVTTSALQSNLSNYLPIISAYNSFVTVSSMVNYVTISGFLYLNNRINNINLVTISSNLNNYLTIASANNTFATISSLGFYNSQIANTYTTISSFLFVNNQISNTYATINNFQTLANNCSQITYDGYYWTQIANGLILNGFLAAYGGAYFSSAISTNHFSDIDAVLYNLNTIFQNTSYNATYDYVNINNNLHVYQKLRVGSDTVYVDVFEGITSLNSSVQTLNNKCAQITCDAALTTTILNGLSVYGYASFGSGFYSPYAISTSHFGDLDLAVYNLSTTIPTTYETLVSLNDLANQINTLGTISGNLSNYVTKTQFTNTINNVYNQINTISSLLPLYCTISSVVFQIKTSSNSINASLVSNYVTKSLLNTTISGYVTNSSYNTTLSSLKTEFT
jgi:hypothetical protein